MSAFHRQIVKFLRNAGATDVKIDAQHRHPRVYFTIGGVRRFRVLSNTPSDRSAENAAIRDLHHALGAHTHGKRVGARRTKRRPRSDRTTSTAPAFSALPDWRSALLGALSPAARAVRLHNAWIEFWRSCMAAVGASSQLRPIDGDSA